MWEGGGSPEDEPVVLCPRDALEEDGSATGWNGVVKGEGTAWARGPARPIARPSECVLAGSPGAKRATAL